MALDNEFNEVYDSKHSYFSDDDDDIDDLYYELYDSLVKTKKDLNKKLLKMTCCLRKLNN